MRAQGWAQEGVPAVRSASRKVGWTDHTHDAGFRVKKVATVITHSSRGGGGDGDGRVEARRRGLGAAITRRCREER